MVIYGVKNEIEERYTLDEVVDNNLAVFRS